jgi:hypothetical protein
VLLICGWFSAIGGGLPLVSGIFGFPAGFAGFDAFPLSYPQGSHLSGKNEPN